MSQSNSSSAASGGVSIAGLLGVAFVVMKLAGVINWSWWWVLLPFYGPMAIFAVVFVVVFVFIFVREMRR